MTPSWLRTLLVLFFLSSKQIHSRQHYHVKVWQPPIDTANLTEPVRFWELVEWRPVSEQTTTISITTTTTSPSPPPPPTAPPCDISDPDVLLKRMKDSGAYNEIYMAPDFITASERFPDLSGRRYTRPKSKYTCDNHCERSSQLVRMIMNGAEDKPTPSDPPRTWWDPSKWEEKRNRRAIRQSPEGQTRRAQLEAKIQSALMELEHLEEADTPVTEIDFEEEYKDFFSKGLPSRRRTKRSLLGDLLHSNSGSAKDVVGTTIALECKGRNDASDSTKEGYQFCQTCRAVRHLPKTYFPRILNEVICAESSCVRGDGKCAQRFLPFRVLRNDGTENCPRWKMISVDIRTCCDCVVHPYSPFVRYLEAN